MLVVMGGYGRSTHLSSVEVLDLSMNQIDCQILDLPMAIGYHQAVTVDGRPALCGGYDQAFNR